ISYPGPPNSGMKPIATRLVTATIETTVCARDRRTSLMAGAGSSLRLLRGAAVGRRNAAVARPRDGRLEDQAQDFVHAADELDVEVGAHFGGNVLEIALVAVRNQHALQAGAMRREN